MASLDQPEKIINNKYKVLNILSSNFDKRVYLCEDDQKKIVVCKRIKLMNDRNSDIKNYEYFERELEYLKEYSNKERYPHLNIIQYIEDFKTEKPSKDYHYMNIITEYYENGDLSNLKRIDFNNLLYLFIKMLIILKEFESIPFIHRDIKPSNIFYRTIGKNEKNDNLDYEFYLGDLGISRVIKTQEKERPTFIGTNGYMAPEIVKQDYDQTVDIYSLGITLLELSKLNSSPYYNKVFIQLFNKMKSEDPSERPTIDQMLEFFVRLYDSLRFSLIALDFSHNNIDEAVQYVKSYGLLNQKLKCLNFKINTGDEEYSIFKQIKDQNNGNYISIECYNLLSSFKILEVTELYLEMNNNVYRLSIIPSPNTDLLGYLNLFSDQNSMSTSTSTSISSISTPSLLKQLTCEGSKVYYLFDKYNTKQAIVMNPLSNNFKEVSVLSPIIITKQIQLRILFETVMLVLDLFNLSKERSLWFYFQNWNGYDIIVGSNNNIKFTIPVALTYLSLLSDYKFKNVFESIFQAKYKDIGIKDPVIEEVYNLFENFKSNIIPYNNMFISVYQDILLKHKSRLVNENPFLKEYYNKLHDLFQTVYSKRSIKTSTISSNSIIKPINRNPKLNPIYFIKSDDNDYKIVTTFVVQDQCKEIINQSIDPINIDELLNFEKYQFENGYYYYYFKPSNKLINAYFAHIKNDNNKTSTDENIDKTNTIHQKDQLFCKLASDHLRNLTVINENPKVSEISKKYGLETFVLNNELFYYYDISCTNLYTLIGSIHDIALKVYDDDTCEQILALNIFKYLNYLKKYSYQIRGHLFVNYSISNSYYYLNKLFLPILNNNFSVSPNNTSYSNDPNYSTIQIGNINYNILNIINNNLVKDQNLEFDFKTINLILQDVNTQNEYYCFRKQDKSLVNITLLENNSIDFNERIKSNSNQINRLLLVPDYVVQDFNTSYYFFKNNNQITNHKTIEDFNENSYNNIIIIRSLLYYLDYLISNKSESNIILFINSKLILDSSDDGANQNNDSDYLLLFDLVYFIKRIYNFDLATGHWKSFINSIINEKSLISNYLQSNIKLINNDPISQSILNNNINLKNKLDLLNVDLICYVKGNVALVNIGQNKYIRKVSGSIECIKQYLREYVPESKPFFDLFSSMVSLNKFMMDFLYPAIKEKEEKNKPVILGYQTYSEISILQMIKGIEGVVQINNYYIENDIIYVLLDFYQNYTNLSEFKVKNTNQLIQIFKQMVKILERLEMFDIYHFDIKHENILIKEDNNGEITCILTDFGISGIGSILKQSEDKYYCFDGTLGYQAPEIYITEHRSKNKLESLSNKYDIYSLGCVILSIIKPNIHGKNIKTEFKDLSQDYIDIFSKMITNNYDDRIDLKQLIEFVNI